MRIDSNDTEGLKNQFALKIGSLVDLKSGNAGKIMLLNAANGFYEVDVDFNDGDYFTFITGEDLFLGLDPSNSFQSARLVPNPSQNGHSELQFISEYAGSLKLSVYDNSGRIIIEQNMSLVEGINRQNIDLSNFSTGIYMVVLQSEHGQSVLKLIR